MRTTALLAAISLALAAPLAATAQAVLHYSPDYTIGQLLDDPSTAAVLDRYMPGFSTSAQIQLAKGLTLAQMASFAQAGIDATKLKAISQDLAKITAKSPPAG